MTADHRPGAPDPRIRTLLEDALSAVRNPAAWLQRNEALTPDDTPVPAPWTEAHRMCASVALRRAAELRIDTDPGSGAAWSDALQRAMTLVAAAAGRLPEPDRDTDPDFTGLVDQLDAILSAFNDEATHHDVLRAFETAIRNAP